MINSRAELNEYLQADKLSLGIHHKRPRLFRDEIWKFEIALRRAEYACNCSKGIFGKCYKILTKIFYHRKSIKLGFTIPLNVFGKGLSIAHYGTIVINSNAHVGNWCRIQDSTTIGATNGSSKAPQIGDYCFIGSGARIIGDVKIAKGVCIGANAVIVKDIKEEYTTWAGEKKKKISNQGSQSNLLIEEIE